MPINSIRVLAPVRARPGQGSRVRIRSLASPAKREKTVKRISKGYTRHSLPLSTSKAQQIRLGIVLAHEFLRPPGKGALRTLKTQEWEYVSTILEYSRAETPLVARAFTATTKKRPMSALRRYVRTTSGGPVETTFL